MQSIAHHAAGHTAAQPRPAPAANHGLVLNVGSLHLPVTWGLVGLVGIVLLCVFADKAGKGKRSGAAADKAIEEAVWGTAKAVWGLLRFLARLLSGLPLRASAERTDATWFRPGTAPQRTQQQPKVDLASLAPGVTLRKRPAPRPWVRRLVLAVQSYQGRAARVLACLAWCFRQALRVGRAVRTAHRAVWPVIALAARTLRAWGRWPYTARAAARIGLLGALVGLAVPAWRGWTITGLSFALVVLVAVVARAAHRPGPQLGDDAVYGPRIWAILRDDLSLPEDEPRENWLLLPPSLADPAARIIIRLPWTWRGGEIDRNNLTALINSRLPGEWVPRVTLTGETFTAVYTHKPAPVVVPEAVPPAFVDVFDPKVQEILANLGPEEFYLGQNEDDQPVIQKMSGEQAHWALSVGSGGGKSAFMQFLAVQMVMKRGTILPIDPKMISLTPLLDVEGVHPYVDPTNSGDMRAALLWAAEVVKARNYEKKKGIRTEFDPLYIIMEECNELADILKEEYTATKQSGDPAGDPIWREGVAKSLRLGREVNVHIIAVFQDFKDNQFGGVSLMPLFPMKILGSYNERQWKRLFGTGIPMIPTVKKAGRMVLLLDDGTVNRIQTPYVAFDPEKSKDENQKAAYATLAAYYKDLRATHGYSAEGLYVPPPAPSPEEMPALLRLLSRDDIDGLQGGVEGPWEGAYGDKAAGELSPEDGDVTARRDAFRLIPGQAGTRAASGAPADLTAPPVLLTVAEIGREMRSLGYDIKDNTIRQHKTRRETTGFPEGITVNGAERWVLSQVIHFYEGRGVRPVAASE